MRKILSEHETKADDIVIAVIGPTGSGKSTFVCAASGRDMEVGHTLKSCTNQVSTIRFRDQESGRHVVLVDTPGLDPLNDTSESNLRLISKWLISSYDKKKLLSGILYLHRITDNRMEGSSLTDLRDFHMVWRRDTLDNVYLTTTMWDEVEEKVGEKRLEELRTEYWKAMIDKGAQVALCGNDDDSPRKVIRRIICSEYSNAPYKGPPSQPPPSESMELTSPHSQEGPQGYTISQRGILIRQRSLRGAEEIVNAKDLKADDIVIVVVGPTGSGKSTFVCAASGRDTMAVGHTLKPSTNQVSAIRFWDEENRRHIVLVDTPDFNDMFRSDILSLISDWLVSSYDNEKLLSGILYLHRITDNRMAGLSLKNLRVFQKVYRGNPLDKVYLTTTMWDKVESNVGERRLEELKTEYWKAMINQGAQIRSENSKTDTSYGGTGRDPAPTTQQGPTQVPEEPEIANAKDQKVDDILVAGLGQSSPGNSTEPNQRASLSQNEMVRLKRGLKETAAGQQLYSQLETSVEKQLLLVRRIDEERKGTMDPEVLQELQAEYDDLRSQVDDKLRQMQHLRLPWLKRFFSQKRD